MHETPQTLRALAQLEEDAIFIGDPSGRLHEVNAATCALTGYRKSELLAMNASDLVAPEWLPFTIRQRSRKIEARQDVTRYECVLLTKDGVRVPVAITSTLVKENGNVVAIRAIARDLRKKDATERRLEESEERFRNAFDGAAIGMAMVAPDGRWLHVNDALTRLLGYSVDELLASTFQEITYPDDLERDLEAVQDILAGRVSWYHMEKRYVCKDGSLIWGLLAVSLVRDANGEPAYFISQISDITAEKTAERVRFGTLAALPSEPTPLSSRETEVVNHLADGHSTLETAAALGIAEETVQTLVKRAMRKLGVSNRTHLVATALRLGLLTT